MKLGWPRSRPLLRMYAVRRETSPAAGSSTNVVITNLPEGNSSSGPRSTSLELLPLEGGGDEQAERRDGDDPADHGSEAERRALEELVAREPLGGARLGLDAWPAGAAAAAGGLGRRRRLGAGMPPERSRTQRKPKTTAIAPPTATTGQLTISPTSRQARPTANPTGHRVGAGAAACRRPDGFQASYASFSLTTGFKRSAARRVNDVTLDATAPNYDASAASERGSRTRPTAGRPAS